jgi:hypothetical protein
MARDSWHARSWRDKLYVWWAPPGWRPADVAARFPKTEYDPRKDFVRFDPRRSVSLSLYIAVQFGVLLAANSHFLALLPKQALGGNLLYFGFLAASLVILGGLLENRRMFLVIEAGRMVSIAAVVMITGGWFGSLPAANARTAMMACALGSLAWLLVASRGAASRAAEAC